MTIIRLPVDQHWTSKISKITYLILLALIILSIIFIINFIATLSLIGTLMSAVVLVSSGFILQNFLKGKIVYISNDLLKDDLWQDRCV